ncbi:MAG: hypothetical protein R2793_00360 [Flavobacteriaceae bacterium]
MRYSFCDKELITIDYEHIPFQKCFIAFRSQDCTHSFIEKRGESIGYINGAGDAIPESLKQMPGCRNPNSALRNYF